MSSTGAQTCNRDEADAIALHIVLYQPEIPQNTGNIGRTCVALNAKLWIVRPTGFRLDATQLKRAGLDYWQHLNWETVADWDELERRLPAAQNPWLLTKFGDKEYFNAEFKLGDVIVIGRETNGLPHALLERFCARQLRIPMLSQNVRSLNQASSTAIVAYEAARQMQLLSEVPGMVN